MRGSGRRRTSWRSSPRSVSRSGLSPTATITAPAFSVPTHFELKQTGASSSTKGTMNRSSSAISSMKSRILRARDYQGELGRDHRVSIADRVRPPGRTGTQARHAGEVAETLVTHFLRCGNDGVVELLQGRAAALDCRLSRRSQHPQGFHAAGTDLSATSDPASCARRLGRGDRIQGVVLALGSSAGWVRPGHLEHRGYPRVPGAGMMPAP